MYCIARPVRITVRKRVFQVHVDEKTHEIPIAKQVLPRLPIRQRVCAAISPPVRRRALALLGFPKGGRQSFTSLAVGLPPFWHGDLSPVNDYS
ncbi:MAG: hypothetical protein E6J04_20455 [Chloroflexi bacterium]|nr:MAG: hypothetical protein E6J04_20455 [Chloroflexota bacterium]